MAQIEDSSAPDKNIGSNPKNSGRRSSQPTQNLSQRQLKNQKHQKRKSVDLFDLALPSANEMVKPNDHKHTDG